MWNTRIITESNEDRSQHIEPITTQAEESCHQSNTQKTDKDVQSLHTNIIVQQYLQIEIKI